MQSRDFAKIERKVREDARRRLMELKREIAEREARAREEREAAARGEKAVHRKGLSLVDYVATLDQLEPRGVIPPRALARGAELFERAARGEPVRACLSVPSRRGKTTLVMGAIIKRLEEQPETLIGYAMHTASVAHDKSDAMRRIATEVGVPISQTSRSVGNWRTGIGNGGVWVTGIDGAVMGQGFNLLVVDDPFKGFEDAGKAGVREHVYKRFKKDFLSRLNRPKRDSCIVVHTRWDTDDLIGRLVNEGWEWVNLPAIAEEGDGSGRESGTTLFPELVSLEEDLHIRDKEHGGRLDPAWRAVYQGDPQLASNRKFRECVWIDQAELPPMHELDLEVGLDFNHGGGDSHAYVLLGRRGEEYFVIETECLIESDPAWKSRLMLLEERLGADRVEFCAYVSHTEQGSVLYLRAEGSEGAGVRTAHPMPTSVPKPIRATKTASAWMRGSIKVVRTEGNRKLVAELHSFDGSPGGKDDRVDALVSAFDRLAQRGRVDWSEHDRLWGKGTPPRIAR